MFLMSLSMVCIYRKDGDSIIITDLVNVVYSTHTCVHLAVMLFNLVLCKSVFSVFLHAHTLMLLTLVMQLIIACHADLEGPDVDCNVIAHGSGTRVSSHATTDVDSDENSEDDSDVGSDESYISSDVGRDVGRDVDSAMQDGDVRVICDEVTDAQDLRAPTMQECVPEAVFSAAGSSTDCSPCIVNSIKQHLDMRIESKTALWNMSVEYCKSIVTVKHSFTSYNTPYDVRFSCRTTFRFFVSWCSSYYSS